MPVALVRQIRGTARRNSIEWIRVSNSLVRFSNANPALNFLDPPTVAAMQQVNIRLVAQLLAKRPR